MELVTEIFVDGTVIEREMNNKELAQCEIDQVNKAAQAEAAKQAGAAKAALLVRLGITADEAKLLLS